MAEAATSYIATARSDGNDWLVDADEPLASLQTACGGTLPGLIAIPELLSVVRKCRRYGFPLARSVRTQTDTENVKAWVELTPAKDGSGCNLGIVTWAAEPLGAEPTALDVERQRLIGRTTAEVVARLDARQNVLAVTVQADDLREFSDALRRSEREPWTNFVQLADAHHKQPMHWRLLDGMTCTNAGSERVWNISLMPIGRGGDGFELLLSAQTAISHDTGAGHDEQTQPVLAKAAPMLGRDLGPVLRQPISRIIANAETIRTRLAGPLAGEYSDYAADISSAGQHLLSLVEDLSDLEVVEADSFTTAPDNIDLGDCARRTVGILGVKAQDKSITLIAPTEDQSLPAIGEFRRVLQVLLNLVGNAINYSPEGSTVTLSLQRESGLAAITVADQGAGLDEEQRTNVFEKFERLGRSGDGGSGLGLYISRKLARAMGGDLTVASEPGMGARFTLTVPAEGASD